MKTKIITIILFYICFIFYGCKEDITDCDDWTNHSGVEYKINGIWTAIHETEIDISETSNDFILEFKTFGVDSVTVIGNDDVTVSILDQIERNQYRQIVNEPFEYSERQGVFKYIQKLQFKTAGQKMIKVKFHYVWHIPNECTSTLVRK